MNKIFLAAAACAALMVSGCGGDSATSGGAAFLRVIHASPDAGSLNVEVQDVPIATELAFGGSVPSAGASAKQVASGFDTMAILSSDTGTVLFDLTPTFEAGHIYTVLAAGLANGGSSDDLQVLGIDDAISGLTAASANLRFVNTSTVSGAVDVYVTGADTVITSLSPTVSNLTRYNYSSLVTVAPGAFRVRVCPKGSKTPTIDLTGTAGAGTYTVDVLENNSDNSGSILQGYSGAF